jgi:hypothetical protein
MIPDPRLIPPFLETLSATSLRGFDEIDKRRVASGFGVSMTSRITQD